MRPQVAVAVLVSTVLLGCANSGSTEATNREVLDSLPVFPNAVRVGVHDAKYQSGPEGPVVGVQTAAEYRAAASSAGEVMAFYQTELSKSCVVRQFDQGSLGGLSIPGIPQDRILRPQHSVSVLARCGTASVVVNDLQDPSAAAQGIVRFEVVVDVAPPTPPTAPN